MDILECIIDKDLPSLRDLVFKNKDIIHEQNDELFPLDDACLVGFVEGVRLLIEAKTNVNSRTRSEGWTPLLYAASEGHTKCIELLIEHGADINATSISGSNALTIACIWGYRKTAYTLIQSGIDKDAKCTYGYTPFWWAVLNEHYNLAEMLLDAGVKELGKTSGYDWVKTTLAKRRRTKDTILFVETLLRKRLGVCKDMANEIGKKIWETRGNEKWALEGGAQIKRIKK